MEEILPRSRRDSETHKHHGEISTNLGEILVISVRWRISRQDLARGLERSCQSQQDLGKKFAPRPSVESKSSLVFLEFIVIT